MRTLLIALAVLPVATYAGDAPPSTPLCEHPARLEHQPRGRGDMILFNDKVDLRTNLTMIGKKYSLTPTANINDGGLFGVFVPHLSSKQTAQLRCEPGVEVVRLESGTYRWRGP